jgi:acyl dehydratase
VVERVKLIEYAQALHLRNPVHKDLAAAQAAGFRDVIAPPGFVTSNALQSRAAKLAAFEIDERRALVGELRFEHTGVICAGDELSGQSTLIALSEKEGRSDRLTVFTIETVFDNQFGERVLALRETILERQGADDGRA